MKKIMRGVLKIMARLGSHSRNGYQNYLDSKTTTKLQDWICDKQYLKPEQTMEDVAKDLDITKEELSYYCKTVIQKNFLTWRKELRIEEAKRIMRLHPEIPLKQVGEMVGIPDLTNFKRQFYEVTGVHLKDFNAKTRA